MARSRNNHGRIQGRAGVELRKRRLARSKGLCEDCLDEGNYREATQVDHVLALCNGGQDIDENTRNLCDPHHDAKTRRDMGYRDKPAYGLDGWPL